jgi:hypothetical protein
VFTRTCHWIPPWSRWIQSTSAYILSLTSTLILSSHLGLDLRTGLFLSEILIKILYEFSILFFHVSCTPHPSHPPRFDHADNITTLELNFISSYHVGTLNAFWKMQTRKYVIVKWGKDNRNLVEFITFSYCCTFYYVPPAVFSDSTLSYCIFFALPTVIRCWKQQFKLNEKAV